MNNVKKGVQNVSASFVGQMVTLILGFVIPRLVIVSLGSETNGLLSSTRQFLAYASLLEAGMSVASLQAMYGPVAKGDYETASDIMSETHRFFKKTGILYLLVVIVLSFILPITISSSFDKLTIGIIVLLTGLPGAINYFSYTKYTVLLGAEGRQYVYTNLTTVATLLSDLGKIALLLLGFGIVEILFLNLLITIIRDIAIYIYIKKHYHWLSLSSNKNLGVAKQSKHLLVHQVSGLIFSNTDILLLTYFCGLKTVSVYSLYIMVFDIVNTLINNFNGFNFILGQSYQLDKKKFIRYLDIYECWNLFLTFSLFSIGYFLILPFIEIYTKGVTDIIYVDKYLPILFITTYLLTAGRNSSLSVINVAKRYKETKWHAIVEMIINIFVSIICVFKFGIYGVLFGTIAALLFRTNAMIIYANFSILNRSPWKTYKRWLAFFVSFFVSVGIYKLFFADIIISGYINFCVFAVVAAILIFILYGITLVVLDKDAVLFLLTLGKDYIKGKLKK